MDGERGTWTVRYTAPVTGLARGANAKLVLFGRECWSMFQCDDPNAPEISGADDPRLYDDDGRPYYGTDVHSCSYIGARTSCGHIVKLATRNSMMTREAWVALPDGLPPGEALDIVIGDDTSGGLLAPAPQTSGTVRFDLYVDTEGQLAFRKLPDSPVLTIHPGPAARLKVCAPSCVQVDTPFAIHIVAFDAVGNPCENYEDTVTVTGADPASRASLDDVFLSGGQCTVAVQLEGPGVHRLAVSSARAGGPTGVSNPIKATEETPTDPIWWGDPHGHSQLCDGREAPDYFFRYARDVEHLDFTALTGHDDCLLDRNFWGLPQSPYWRTSQDAWAISKYIANHFHNPGRFVSFVAYEWGGSAPLSPLGQPRFGDRCVYFPGDDGEIFAEWDDRYDAPSKLWDAVRARGGLVIPHHPGYAREGPLCGMDWEYHDDTAEPLVEIYSKHGSSECDDTARPLVRPRSEGMIQWALQRGHKVGFVGGSDTHITRPGSDIREEDIAVHPYTQAGLTAVRSAALTRCDLLDALRRRRCYATTGERIWLDFRFNGEPMGSEVTLEPDAPRRLTVEVHGTAALKSVEIVSDGAVMLREAPGTLSAEISFVDETPCERSRYYYARVTQENGSLAWSSPIWVTGM
jgi:hypothetical protein